MADPLPSDPTTTTMPSALIVGISGPSSSGKTTLARLLQRVFCGVSLGGQHAAPGGQEKEQEQEQQEESGQEKRKTRLNTFIIHEDDFYYPDDKIPWTTTPSGKTVQDWDTAAAIDIDFMAEALSHVRANGTLPPRLRSKEDQNEATDSGVPDEIVAELRAEVERRLLSSSSASAFTRTSNDTSQDTVNSASASKTDTDLISTIAFLEGFLLYSPPLAENQQKDTHVLRPVQEQIHLRLFLPAAYDAVKSRREGRSGYVTIGSAGVPPSGVGATGASDEERTRGDRADEGDEDAHRRIEERTHTPVGDTANVNLADEEGDEGQAQNFWTDPPGYVDDVVWPRYVADHAWLLLPADGGMESQSGSSSSGSSEDLVRRVGDGTNVRTDVGVEVAPGQGRLPMVEVLRWAVQKVLQYYLT